MPKTPTQKVISKKHLARIEKERLQRRFLIIGSAVVLALVLGLVGYGLLDQLVLKMIRPVATVDGQKISVKDFQSQVKFARWQTIQQYQQQYQYYQLFASSPQFAQQFQQNLLSIQTQLDNTTGFGNSILDNMVDDILIQEEATRRNITVSKEEVDKYLQENFGYFANGTPTAAPTETLAPTSTYSPTQLALVPPTPTVDLTLTPEATEFPTETATPAAGPTATVTPTEAPTATATPYTLEGFQKVYSDFVDNSLKPIQFTDAQLREYVTKTLVRQKVFEAITADVKPVQEEVWARHILVADELTANAVIDRLKKGEDFAKVAQEVSTDTSTAVNGGDLGWFSRGKMVPEFETVAFSLNVGEISGPVKTQYGFHIIQVLGHEERPVDASTLQTLKSTKFQDWLKETNTKAKITRREDIKDIVPVEPTIPAEMQNVPAPQSGMDTVPTQAAPAETTPQAQPSATPQP